MVEAVALPVLGEVLRQVSERIAKKLMEESGEARLQVRSEGKRATIAHHSLQTQQGDGAVRVKHKTVRPLKGLCPPRLKRRGVRCHVLRSLRVEAFF